MKKITTLTKSQYNKFVKAKGVPKEIRTLLNIPDDIKLHIGDSLVEIGETTNVGDVFEYTASNGSKFYYIVVAPLDDELSGCWSIY